MGQRTHCLVAAWHSYGLEHQVKGNRHGGLAGTVGTQRQPITGYDPDPEKLAGFLPFDSEKAAFLLGQTPSPTENKIKAIAHKNSLYFFQCLSSAELKGR